MEACVVIYRMNKPKGRKNKREKGRNLSIPLYVQTDNGDGNSNGTAETVSLQQAIADWQKSSIALRESMEGLFEVLEQQSDHFPGGKEAVRDQFRDSRKLMVASGGKRPPS